MKHSWPTFWGACKEYKGHTCRALILPWTFSWDKTLAGSASVGSWSSRKMLSWDNAREPIVPLKLLKTEVMRKSWRRGMEHGCWTFPATHTKSSSDPSPFPAVTSLADWLSLAFASWLVFLRLLKRVFSDLILECLRPAKINTEMNPDRSSVRRTRLQSIQIILTNSSAAHIVHILTFCLPETSSVLSSLSPEKGSISLTLEKAKKCVFRKRTSTECTCSNNITMFKVGHGGGHPKWFEHCSDIHFVLMNKKRRAVQRFITLFIIANRITVTRRGVTLFGSAEHNQFERK